MTYKAPSREALQAECDAFNFECRVGGPVAVKIDGTDKPRITTTRSRAQILSGHSAVVWLEGVSGCYLLSHVTPIPEADTGTPAWAVFAESGNIIIWSHTREPVERAATRHGRTVQPILMPKPVWSADAPTEQGGYWHWNGDPDSAVNYLHVLWSGFGKACFISAGQVDHDAVFCEQYGGYWTPAREPRIPETLPKKGASQ